MGKIGIFVSEHHGDMALCSCVLKYKDILWPGKEIVWYCSLSPERASYLDLLKHNDAISEIRDWPDVFFKEISANGKLLLDKAAAFDSMKDLECGYFPAPWAVLPNNALNNMHYANIPRFVYGADPSWEWHPYLGFSEEEKEEAREFRAKLPHTKTIMLETQLRSAGNFILDDEIIADIIKAARAKFGQCNFIFASKVDHSKFFDDAGVVSCSHVGIRQAALIHNHCDLFVGVCSGITQAASAWGNKPVPRVEMCGTPITSSVIANGPVRSVICDNWTREQMKERFPLAVAEEINKL